MARLMEMSIPNILPESTKNGNFELTSASYRVVHYTFTSNEQCLKNYDKVI